MVWEQRSADEITVCWLPADYSKQSDATVVNTVFGGEFEGEEEFLRVIPVESTHSFPTWSVVAETEDEPEEEV